MDVIPPNSTILALLAPRGPCRCNGIGKKYNFVIKFLVLFDPPKYLKSRPTQIHLKLLGWMSSDLIPPFGRLLTPRVDLQVQRHRRKILFFYQISGTLRPTQIFEIQTNPNSPKIIRMDVIRPNSTIWAAPNT